MKYSWSLFGSTLCNAFSADVSKSQDDILFLDSSVPQVLKCGSPYQLLVIAITMSLDTFNYIFFRTNDSTETKSNNNTYTGDYNSAKGSHWSLTLLSQ